MGCQWIFPWEKKSWNHNCQNAVVFFFFLIFGTFGLLVDSRNLFHYFKKLLPQIFYEKATRRQFLAEKSHVTLARKLRSKRPEIKSRQIAAFTVFLAILKQKTHETAIVYNTCDFCDFTSFLEITSLKSTFRD